MFCRKYEKFVLFLIEVEQKKKKKPTKKVKQFTKIWNRSSWVEMKLIRKIFIWRLDSIGKEYETRWEKPDLLVQNTNLRKWQKQVENSFFFKNGFVLCQKNILGTSRISGQSKKIKNRNFNFRYTQAWFLTVRRKWFHNPEIRRLIKRSSLLEDLILKWLDQLENLCNFNAKHQNFRRWSRISRMFWEFLK